MDKVTFRWGIMFTAIIVLLSGGLVWSFSLYGGPSRRFSAAYDGYRAVPQSDASKLDQWDRQLNEAYQTMKEAITAGNKTAAKNHLTPFGEILGAQEDFFRAQAVAQKAKAARLPDLKTRAAALDGRAGTLAVRLAAQEEELLKLGTKLNDGSLRETNLWHQLGNNFTSFLNGEVDGAVFLREEAQIGQRIEAGRKAQEDPGRRAQVLIAKINADWKALKKLL